MLALQTRKVALVEPKAPLDVIRQSVAMQIASEFTRLKKENLLLKRKVERQRRELEEAEARQVSYKPVPQSFDTGTSVLPYTQRTVKPANNRMHGFSTRAKTSVE